MLLKWSSIIQCRIFFNFMLIFWATLNNKFVYNGCNLNILSINNMVKNMKNKIKC